MAFAVNTPRLNQVGGRENNQSSRIQAGLADGSLNPDQATQLQGEQAQLSAEAESMKAQHGGHLTPEDQATLNQHLNALSSGIWDARHPGGAEDPNAAGDGTTQVITTDDDDDDD